MQIRKTWLILMLIALLALWGCSDDDDAGPTAPTVTAFEHLATLGGAYINSAAFPGIISAANAFAAIDDYTVIDLRQETHFNDPGHIEGAYLSSLPTLLDDLENDIPSDKPYLLVCYTGQTVGIAKMVMQLMGLEVYSMGYGMSAWNPATASNWNSGAGDQIVAWETAVNELTVEHDFPDLAGPNSTILERRIDALLDRDGGWPRITWSAIQADLEDYFILNYHPEAAYLGQHASGLPGHIPGAYHFEPGESLGLDQLLKYLPTDQRIVVYCWTGQQSAQLAAYLYMLGYDAVSLLYGVNALCYSDLNPGGWKWNPQMPIDNDFPLVTPEP
jgi:rhodanese-related sulfurtransferase